MCRVTIKEPNKAKRNLFRMQKLNKNFRKIFIKSLFWIYTVSGILMASYGQERFSMGV